MRVKYYKWLWEMVRLLNMMALMALALAFVLACEFTPSALIVLGILWLGYQRNPYCVYISDKVD